MRMILDSRPLAAPTPAEVCAAEGLGWRIASPEDGLDGSCKGCPCCGGVIDPTDNERCDALPDTPLPFVRTEPHYPPVDWHVLPQEGAENDTALDQPASEDILDATLRFTLHCIAWLVAVLLVVRWLR